MADLTDSQKARVANVQYALAGLGLIGGIGGVIYSSKTGGGTGRAVGYFILGALVLGTVGKVISLPFVNKIIAETPSVTQVTPANADPKTESAIQGALNSVPIF